MKKKNLYLLAFYTAKPKDPNRTGEKGYITNPDNLIYDETINITKGLKTQDESTAKVILNLTDQLVHKNNFNDNMDFPSLLAYYQEGYAKYINPLLAQIYSEQMNENKGVDE